MNYYKRHLGDYAAATRHLSVIEHGAYSLLLDTYYVTEAPLPADERALHRLVGARSDDERAAVNVVLAEFFVLADGCWRHKRCDAEIATARERGEESSARLENEKERQRRHRERRRETFAMLRERGIVPAWDSPSCELSALLQTVGEPVTPPVTLQVPPVTRTVTLEDAPVTRFATAIATSHKPVTSNHKEDKGEARKRATPPVRPDDVDEGTWADWLQLRKGKRAAVTGTVIAEARKEANKAGLPLQKFLAIWCARGSQGLQAEWLKPDVAKQMGGGYAAQRNRAFAGEFADDHRFIVEEIYDLAIPHTRN